MTDPHDLRRFRDAQEPVIAAVRRELVAGCKQSHWMWFVFPQMEGLGASPMALRYAIRSLAEARAYLADAVLGPRLLDGTRLVNAVEGRSAHAIFGTPDDMKFRSSMTLFEAATPEEPAFAEALRKYFGGERDPRTLDRLASG